jgi:uncharacterized protein YggT (Ycf19 family)
MNWIFTIYIFLDLIKYLVFADVILSWAQLIWIKWRPKFLSSIIDPLYKNVKSILPTSIWPIDFTPIVILLIIIFLTGLVELFFPNTLLQYNFSKSDLFSIL